MIRIFPVAAPTTISNDFGAARSGGRLHQGNDLFAAIGSPLVAVDDGQLRSGTDPLGGNVVNLYATDGSKYYYAHLDAFVDIDGSRTSSPPSPRTVRAGDVVGFLGQTGNAATTQPHVHFEAHPNNGPAVDPFPALSQAPRIEVQPVASPNSTRDALLKIAGLALVTGTVWSLVYPKETEALLTRISPMRLLAR